LVPQNGIYAGAAGENRAAVSIGTNPHYGGSERRVEAFLLDFAGDLYGKRLVVELWERLRDEQSFESEQALIDQIARDVGSARARRRVPESDDQRNAVSAWVARRARRCDDAHAPEEVVL